MTTAKYKEFLKSKKINQNDKGFKIQISKLSDVLYDFQKFCVQKALSKGRFAIFSDCGTGKTLMQLEWGIQIHKKVKEPILLLAPLAVAEQTKKEFNKLKSKTKIKIVYDGSEIIDGINITNYEKLHKFNASKFKGIVLDESGILKNHTGVFRTQIIDFVQNIPYRLACTATPAPNDYMELTNHAEYLGVQSRVELLSTYFIHDSGDTGNWRLKGHVADNIFWEWMSTWAIMFSKPIDIGFDNKSFDLPNITYHQHFVKAPKAKNSYLTEYVTDLTSRRKVRSETVESRCKLASNIINETDDMWLIWCNLNRESELCTKYVNEALEVTGSQKDEIKKDRMFKFADGEIKRLVTKPKIAGFGMNWQKCSNVAFVGLNDSWESLYQAVRRVWRFGQTEEVHVHFFLDEREGPVIDNVLKKEKQALEMQKNMINIFNKVKDIEVNILKEYKPKLNMEIPNWLRTQKI